MYVVAILLVALFGALSALVYLFNFWRRLQWSRPYPGPLMYQDFAGQSPVIVFLILCKDDLTLIVNTNSRYRIYLLKIKTTSGISSLHSI